MTKKKIIIKIEKIKKKWYHKKIKKMSSQNFQQDISQSKRHKSVLNPSL